MAALLSVWTGMACLVLSLVCVVYRPALNDVMLLIILYFGCPGTICIAGLVLWAYRKDTGDDPGLEAQRLQCKAAIGLALAAAAVMYALIIFAQPVSAN